MLPFRDLIFSAIFVIFIGSFFLLRDFIILNEEISSTRAELLKEIWNSHLEETLDADATLVLNKIILAIENSKPAAQCPECPKPICEKCETCESCAPCAPCEICAEAVACPECQICEQSTCEAESQGDDDAPTAGDEAIKLLVTDWDYPKEIPENAVNVTFEDLPVVNNFGKFQRDRDNYNTSRKGYEPRRLVCDELSESLPKVQTRHWIEDCNDVPNYPKEVLSYINFGLPKSVIEKIEKTGMNKTVSKKLATPYVFLAKNLFDFDAEDGNFKRMVREAEMQNADIISGSFVDELGHWTNNCGHIHVSNYTLDIWDGYYKSIKGIMHCDISSGPLLVRKELLQELGAEKTEKLARWPDRLEVLLKLQRERVRFVHCPDCMFYQTEISSKVERKDLMRLSRKFKLTNFNIDSMEENVEFTCKEANIDCHQKYNQQALAQPPCCLTALTGMMLALTHEFKKNKLDLCLYCGQVLATIKMPGGQLPWDTDVDMPSDARMWEEVQKLVVPTLKTKYRLGVDIIKPGERRVGGAVLHHKKTGFSTDNYAKPIEVTFCGHQVLKGRTQTKVNLGGWWVPGPDNPGQYGRHYGDEYLKHVPHVSSSRTAYGATQPRFPRCSGTPSHACLEQFQTDGNIQFRKDKMKLYTLF